MASMRQHEEHDYFGELPQALVEQLVARGESLGNTVTDSLEKVKSLRERVRKQLQRDSLLSRIDDLRMVPPPTTAGVDGAFGAEPLIGYDLIVVTGLATEGLTPPSERRHWAEPHFSHFINAEPHRDENRSYARALMVTFELEQAAKAPHDVIFLDGSFVTPITALHQAMTQSDLPNHLGGGSEDDLTHVLVERASLAVNSYHLILSAQRSDKAWVSIPKYTTKREIGNRLGVAQRFDDRALCTLILGPGEFVGPIPMEQPSSTGWQGYLLTPKYLDNEAKKLKLEVEHLLKEAVYVVYFRAAPSNPAIRIELPKTVAQNEHRFALVLQAVRSQSALPGVLEPQPLYYADQMAKSLSIAIPSLREMLTRFSARHYTGDISDVFFVLHGYRTEGE
jgi:hypothetical protein